MTTKFSTLESIKKEKEKTVFKQVINSSLKPVETKLEPSAWKNILHLGYDKDYGDVFKCWDNGSDNFTIAFGEKGDEFDN